MTLKSPDTRTRSVPKEQATPQQRATPQARIPLGQRLVNLRLGDAPEPAVSAPTLSFEPRERRRNSGDIRRQVIQSLLSSLHHKDPYTAQHSAQVEIYARCLAEALDVDAPTVEHIRAAAVLHDIGKLGIPDAILTKPGKLTKEEFEVMKLHPAVGAAILEPIDFLSPVVPLVRYHHEWHAGTGYPDGVRSDDIPFGAKVIQVADCIDAMMSPRCYKRGFALSRVISELETGSGVQFDPTVTQVAIDWLKSGPQCVVSRHLEVGVCTTTVPAPTNEC